MAGAEGGGGSRIPNNWQGLFRFCQEATKDEDHTVESTFVEMDPETLKNLAQPSVMRIDMGVTVTDQYGNVLEAQDAADAAAGGPKDAAKDLKDAKRAGAASAGRPQGPGGNPKGPPSDLDPETARINQDKALEALGLYRYRIPGDGNCLYRAVAWQLKFDQEKYHPMLRKVSVKWMREYAQELMASGLLDSPEEVEETDKLGSWPGQAAIVSLANIFGINIAIVQGGDKGDIDIQHIAPFEQDTADQGSVILAYLYNGHYDAVVDTPDMDNPDFERWMASVQKAHSEGTLNAQSPVAQDPYYSYVLHNGYDTLKLRQQEGETLPAYVASSAPASSAPPPHLNDAAHNAQHDTLSLEQEPQRFETDHSLETIRSKADRHTVDLQEIFTPDEELGEYEHATLNGVPPKQDLSLQDTTDNFDKERESGITNKLAYRQGDDILEEESIQDSPSSSPVPMTTDDVMTDLELRERLPSDMFVSSSASSLATESEMSIHLDDEMDTASTNSHFDSDCESRFAQPDPPGSSILFDDVFDHSSDVPEPEQTVTTDPRYTKSLDRRFLRNRSREGLSLPQEAGDLEEGKSRVTFRPRQKIQRSAAKEATPYQRPQAPEKKSEGWGINTNELLQAAGVTHAKPGETMAQVSQKYGPVKLDESWGISPEDTANKDSGSNTGTLRSERFLAKRKKEGRKFPLLKTDGETGQSNAKQTVLSPPADIPSSTDVLSNLEALRDWRQKYGPQVNKTAVRDGESSEFIREGSYDSPDSFRRSESREESVESVIHVPSQQQKDSSRGNSDSAMRPSMQDMSHTEEMTVAGGYANNTQPLSSGNAMHGDYINNTRSVSSPSRTYASDTGDSNTMTRSLPYKSYALESDKIRSNASSPGSNDGDGPRGFSRRKTGYQHPRLARSRSNDAILDSPDRNGFDPSDSTRGAETNAAPHPEAEPNYDTLKGSARAQALLKSRMRPARSPGRTLGKDPGDKPELQSDSLHKTSSGQSNYASLPYGARRDGSYEPNRSPPNTEPNNNKPNFSSLPPQPFFDPDTPGPSVPSDSQPSQSHPNFSSSRPSMSSSYSSSTHTSEGPGLTNEELVNARRFSLESSQRVEDVLVKDPSHVLPAPLLANIKRAQTSGNKDKASFEASRRFKQAEQDYMQTHPRESETADVGGDSKMASHSNFAKAGNASQHLGQKSSMHEQHVGYNQHDSSMSQVDSEMFNKELTAEEKFVADAYSTQSVSSDVMCGMSALSGISLNKSSDPPAKAPPRFVRQMSSPSMSRKVINQPEMQQMPSEQSKPVVKEEPKVQPKPIVKDEPVVPKPVAQQVPVIEPKPVVREEPIVQPKPFVEQGPTVQPKPFMLQPEQPNAVVQEKSVSQSKQFVEQGPVLQPKAEVPPAPVVPPKPAVPPQPVAQPKPVVEVQAAQQVQTGPELQRPSVQPKPYAQHKPFQPFKLSEIPKKSVQPKINQQKSVTEVSDADVAKDQLAEPQRLVEKEHVSPPVLHAEDSSYGFPIQKEQEVPKQQQHDNELMKSKLYQQQQQKMHEMQQEDEEESNSSAEPASVRRHEITSQVSMSDDVKGSAPRMRVLPLHFVGRKGQTFTRQLSQEEEQALMSRRAKREEYEKQSSKESRDETLQGQSSTHESSHDSFKSATEEPAPKSPPKRYQSVERILVGDANVTVNGTAAAPVSPGVSVANKADVEIKVAHEQGELTKNEVGAKEEAHRVNVVHEVGQQNLFDTVRGGATHSQVESAMRQGAQGYSSEQSTPLSTPMSTPMSSINTQQEEITSPRIIQTDPYMYAPPDYDTASCASSVCSSTGLREVEEIHCHHPGHNHYRNIKARATVPASLLYPGSVTSNQTSPAGSSVSSSFISPTASGPTSPQVNRQGESVPFRRTIPVQVTHEPRKGAFMRSHSHWDDRSNDFEKRVDNMFNEHVERERRGSVPIQIQRVSRQPADGASLPKQGQEKGNPPPAARSNSVPNSEQSMEDQGQDDRPPPGIVKDRLREWVEGQRAHQGNWDSQSQQSDLPSLYSQSTQSDADSQYSQQMSYDESASMVGEDPRAESVTPTPGQGGPVGQNYPSGQSHPSGQSCPSGQSYPSSQSYQSGQSYPRGPSEPSTFASSFRRFNSRPEPQPLYQRPAPQHRSHREFVEEHETTDPFTGGTTWHRSFAAEDSGFADGGQDTWSARVELPNRPDWPRTGRRERFLRLRDRPFFVDADRSFPSLLRPMRHRLRDDIKSAFDDDWFFRH